MGLVASTLYDAEKMGVVECFIFVTQKLNITIEHLNTTNRHNDHCQEIIETRTVSVR